MDQLLKEYQQQEINAKIENKVKEKFSLPRFEMRFLEMASKEVNTFVKIELFKHKCAKLTEELNEQIYEICEQLNYKQSGAFSYHIDRLKQFNDNVQELDLNNYK